MVVTVRTFRRQMADLAAKAADGATIVITRHGRPWALLRPAQPGDRCRPQSVTAFRDDLRRGLLRARQRDLRLTWRGQTLAVVTTAPPDLVLSEDDYDYDS